MPLYNRTCSLVIGTEGGKGKELSGLRIAFSIEKGSTKTPNKCSCRIWNLASSTRKQVELIGNVLILKAGYAEDVGQVQIFAGTVIRSLTTREGPDWVTSLELQDGFFEFRDAKASLSFAPGATTRQVLSGIAAKFGLPIRTLPEFTDKQYPSGFAFVGRVRDAMDKVCDLAGLEWSIQGREIQVIKKGGVYKKRAIFLSPDTGMIGSPEQESQTMTEKAAAKLGFTKNQAGVRTIQELNREGQFETMLMVNGYKVRSLLQPTIEPGGYVQVRSKSINYEFFRVETITHIGDTHSQDWHSEMVLRYV